jgi:hypothetical protein
VFWVISVYFNIRNTLPKYGTFFLGHPVYENTLFNVRSIIVKGEKPVKQNFLVHRKFCNITEITGYMAAVDTVTVL